MSEERSQIDILADYLMEHHADAITGGGAGDVAIRLIQALYDEIERLRSDRDSWRRVAERLETEKRAVIAERDAEIERLRAWLYRLMVKQTRADTRAREMQQMASDAYHGKAVPE